MIYLSKHRLMKYPLFFSLYFSQGIIFALATIIIPIYFIEKGLPIPVTTTIIGIAYIPWILKFIFGGIVDYFSILGRKKFILGGGALGAISFLIASTIDPKVALIPFTIAVFFASMGIAFIDVSADAWAIQTTKEEERGKVNGGMFAGLFSGLTFGSSVIAYIAGTYGYPFAFVVTAVIISLIMLFPLYVKEEIIVSKRQKIGKLLIKEFKKRSAQLASLFSLLSVISFGILAVILPIYMKTSLDLEITQIGLIMSVGNITTVIGNISGGFIADSWGRKKTLYLFLGFNIIFAALLAFVSSWAILVILWGIIGFLHGGHYSTVCALLMDLTNPKIGATQFSIYCSFANMGEMSGTSFSGALVTAIGFGRLFLYSGWIYGPALLVLYLIKVKPYKNKKK